MSDPQARLAQEQAKLDAATCREDETAVLAVLLGEIAAWERRNANQMAIIADFSGRLAALESPESLDEMAARHRAEGFAGRPSHLQGFAGRPQTGDPTP
jgi:hypothetical protein